MAKITSQHRGCRKYWPSQNLIKTWSLFKIQAYKQILFQSNAHRVNYSPTGRTRANKGLKYTGFISQLFADRQVPWESLQ